MRSNPCDVRTSRLGDVGNNQNSSKAPVRAIVQISAGVSKASKGAFVQFCRRLCLSWPRKRCRPALVPWLSTVVRATLGGVWALATDVLPLCMVSHAVFRYARDARER